MEKILVTRSSMPPMEEYMEEIASIWDNHWLTNMGEKHVRLEKELKEYLGVDDITLFSNGHMALELTLQAMHLKGEVITTPYTFASTTHAIVRNGLKPVFCDINPDDYTIDADKIERLITKDTCAIVPVHVYGNICDVDRIQEIADRHGVPEALAMHQCSASMPPRYIIQSRAALYVIRMKSWEGDCTALRILALWMRRRLIMSEPMPR